MGRLFKDLQSSVASIPCFGFCEAVWLILYLRWQYELKLGQAFGGFAFARLFEGAASQKERNNYSEVYEYPSLVEIRKQATEKDEQESAMDSAHRSALFRAAPS